MFLEVFLLKFFDCTFGTLKTTLLLKGKFLLSSIANSLSAVLLIFVASAMAHSDNQLMLGIIIFTANMLGGYLPPKLFAYFEKDKLFVFHITAESLEDGCVFADNLRDNHISVTTYVNYNQDLEKVLHITAYAKTKTESNLINCFLSELNWKFHIINGK